jgi:hypothetical protein
LVIEIGGARLERFLPGRLGRVLFVYLVLNRTRDLPAAELMGSLMATQSPIFGTDEPCDSAGTPAHTLRPVWADEPAQDRQRLKSRCFFG